ncbi:MAG: Rrf2 family transcriptional regulator [Patescibacteria group bacterium]
MKLSRKTYYGLRACLALAQSHETLSIQAISDREGIPFGYLEKILQNLRKANIVEAKKGTTGGYTLSRQPEDISVWSILETLEGPLKTFPATEDGKLLCLHVSHCQTNEVLRTLDNALERSLSEVSLAQLLSGKSLN